MGGGGGGGGAGKDRKRSKGKFTLKFGMLHFSRGAANILLQQKYSYLHKNYLIFSYFSQNLGYTSYALFVLRFYGPVNPMWSCRAQSVYLTTRLLDRLSPLSG